MSTVVDFRSSNLNGVDDAFRDKVSVPRYGEVAWDSKGRGFSHRYTEAIDNFELVPAATVAAGTSKLTIMTGTGTEVIARAVKGGIRLTTQASTPADTNDCMLAGVATTGHDVLLNDNSMPWFHTAVSLPAIATVIAAAGLSVQPASVRPADNTADGATFLADPANDAATGLTAAQLLNWVCVQTVASVETYTATTIPLTVDALVDFRIQFNSERKPLFYINGDLVATGVAATTGGSWHSYVGIETTAASQASLDVGFIAVSRAIY